jgi:phenylalanyl-tRNA synthetase beta chain
MQVSWKWLKELVKVDLSPEEAAARLTSAGIEVEGIEYLNKGVQKVVTGKIVEVLPHPEANKLVVTKVDVGADNLLTIVTGAPNVKAGQCVPVALVGAVLPCETHPSIQLTKLRGVLSEGMMCGADEIGLDVSKLSQEEKEGLYPLPSDTKPGQDIVEFLGLDDVVLEIGLTPNRSDCMGMINIARELSALTGAPLELPEIKPSQPGGKCAELAYVKLEEEGLCSRFGARLVENVKVGPSPLWLKQRLTAMGIRSINNLVDISNLVMLEMNRPLHFFDYDKIAGKGLGVRRAKPGETIETLDGQQRQLSEEMTLVTDEAGGVAIAGVMGGLRTEVTAETKRIMIEAACWNGIRIRRTAQALGLRSEASARFEKEVEAEATIAVLDRAVDLIEALDAGTGVPGHIDVYPKALALPQTWVSLSRINFVLGTELDQETVRKIWQALRITILEDLGDRWLLQSPSWRKDLVIEEDYIEEAARLHGYDRLEATMPVGDTTQGSRTPLHELRRKLTTLLIGQGYRETINYSFINSDHLDRLKVPADHPWRNVVTIKNPLSEDQGILRTTVIPSLLELAVWNINRRNKDLQLFELGKVYIANSNPNLQPDERWTLGILCTGVQKKSWLSPEIPYDFYHLKGIVESSLQQCRIKEVRFAPSSDIPGLHPGRAARIMSGTVELGYMGEIHPQIAAEYEAEQRIQIASLDVAALLQCQDPVCYVPLSKYPEVTRDLAVVVPVDTLACDVMATIKECAGSLLKEINIFDVYQGSQISEGQKSLAFSLTWGSDERTLKDEEINQYHQVIEEKLASVYSGQVRGR